MRHSIPLLPLLLLLTGAALGQTTIVVNPSGGLTIQQAIDQASPSDTVMLMPGTYAGIIDFKGKGITVRSALGPDRTILDGQGAGPVVKFATGEPATALLQGVTVTGGNNSVNGAGIQIIGSSPTVRGCIIRGNRTTQTGGGLGGKSISTTPTPTPVVEDCVFLNNAGSSASGGGGAIGFNGSSPAAYAIQLTVRRCVFRGNTGTARGGAVTLIYNQNADFIDCLFLDNVVAAATSDINGGGAIYFGLNSKGTAINCRFQGNSSGGATGGAIKVFNSTLTCINGTFVNNTSGALAVWNNTGVYNTPTTIGAVNCILWQNLPSEMISNLAASPSVPTITASYCCLTPGTQAATGVVLGAGNIFGDPKLLNPASGNHRILPSSICFNKGDSAATGLPLLDFEGDPRIVAAAVDIGADECDPSKALLWADRAGVSVMTGGTVNYSLAGNASRAGMLHVLFLGLGGTRPGTSLGSFTLPLNLDATAWLMLSAYGSVLVGNLDGSGQAAIPLALPALLPAELIGWTLSGAGLIVNPAGLVLHSATNEEEILFTM